jgi:hypothetical protein
MPNRTFTNNTSNSEHFAKSTAVTPVDTSLAGHTIKVYADYGIWDVTAGAFILPENVTTKLTDGRVVKGLRQ